MPHTQQFITLTKAGAALVGTAFVVFLFMEERHAAKTELEAAKTTHSNEVIHTELEALRQIKLSDSTRYAEIQKFYVDRLKDGEQLTPAEQKRLDLVMAQQERLAEALKNDR